MEGNWIEVELEKVSQCIQYGYTASSTTENVGPKFLRITDIQERRVNWDEVPFCEIEPEKIEKYQLTEGDILFARTGATVGKTFLIRGKIPPSVFASYLIKVRTDKAILDDKYLSYFFDSPNYWIQITENQSGIGQPNVNGTKLGKLIIPIAPLPEQRAIVARIEELFSELDHSVSSLQSAQAKLEIYRQAVLKKAFEGGFTEEWKRKSGFEGWKAVSLGEVAEISRGKSRHRPRNDERLFGGPYPFIQTGDVKAANGGIIKKFTQTYSEFGLEQSRLWPKGTLCLTIAANIADTAFLGIDACFPDSVVGIKTDLNILDLKFLNLLIQKLKNEIDSKASATAQKNINVEFLEKLEIPLPAISEQLQIVQEIESKLSVADKLAETIQTNLQKSEALRQSILKKAFEGRLLSEAEVEACRKEADWEPAERLLERIRSEKKKK